MMQCIVHTSLVKYQASIKQPWMGAMNERDLRKSIEEFICERAVRRSHDSNVGNNDNLFCDSWICMIQQYLDVMGIDITECLQSATPSFAKALFTVLQNDTEQHRTDLINAARQNIIAYISDSSLLSMIDDVEIEHRRNLHEDHGFKLRIDDVTGEQYYSKH